MKILFICGSLERGCDGVGDYTRRIAGECIRQGNPCAVISLNDRNTNSADSQTALPDTEECQSSRQDILEEIQSADGTAVPVLRLCNLLPWRIRIASAKQYVENFNPDCISLQYVPFSFNQKGIPLGLPNVIRKLLLRSYHLDTMPKRGVSIKRGTRREHAHKRMLHIMFHELWVGLGNSPPLRHRLLGFIQFCIVRRLIKACKPVAIHSHSTPYIELLRYSFKGMERLPLFSNIPVHSSIKKRKQGRYNRIAFFGTVYHELDINEVITTLKTLENHTGKKSYIIAIGRGGHYAKDAWKKLRRNYFRVKELGALDEVSISYYLSQCDFGISASCPDLIEKSGAAVAMCAHGLPVIIARKPIWGDKYLRLIKIFNPLIVFRDDITTFMQIEKPPPDSESLQRVVNTLLLAVTTKDYQE